MKDILPLLHQIGNSLINVYPNEPNAFITIAGQTFRFIFINNTIVQIGVYDENTNDITTLLYDVKNS